MNKFCSIIILIVFVFCFRLSAKEINDSIAPVKKKSPLFLTLNLTEGGILPTEDFISKSGKFPLYTSGSIKFGVSPTGEKWQDIAYGMPYYGIGLYYANFYRSKDIGQPLSVYFLQGGMIGHIRHKWSLHYEWNLGVSFNWKHYDPIHNPENIIIGSGINAHVTGLLYFSYQLNKYFDLHLGASITHFSNGASKLPNSGINLIAPFIELKYNINPDKADEYKNYSLKPPYVAPHMDYDISVTITTRQAHLEDYLDDASNKYLDRNFHVFALSFAPLFVRNYKYKWGPSMEFVYDESSGLEIIQEVDPISNVRSEYVRLGKVGKRLSLGFSLKGEIVLPHISLFAQFGYDVLKGNISDKRFYQIAGIKIYLIDNVYGTFGIRANKFSRAQYLYWSVGYTIKGKCRKKYSTIY